MKKFFTMAAIAFAAIAMVSCEKDPNKTGDDENTPTVRKVLLALPSEIDEDGNLVSGRSFRYNADGSLAGVDEVWTNDDGTLGTWNLNVTRSGNKLTLTTDEGSVEYEWEVNEQGYVVKNGDYSYEYDAEGHLTKVIEDWGEGPQVVSICTWKDGNLVSWSKQDEFGPGKHRVKYQTYKTDLNIGGIFTCFTEKSSLKKWMFEAGFFGKPSKNLVDTDKWDLNSDGDGPQENGADFEYRCDDDGYVIAEVKYWKGEVDDETYYIWQPAK